MAVGDKPGTYPIDTDKSTEQQTVLLNVCFGTMHLTHCVKWIVICIAGKSGWEGGSENAQQEIFSEGMIIDNCCLQ